MPSLTLLLLTALLAAILTIAWLVGRLRRAAQEQQAVLALANARAERLDAIIDTTVDGIVVIDTHGRIESFNRGAERLFGYTPAEVVGANVSVLMPPPYAEEHDGYLERYLTTGQAKVIGIGREVAGRRKDGTTFPLQLSVAETRIAGERKFTGILHDLSDRVAMENVLRDQASLARLGEMAAVIAHEVKNPLAAIRGAVQIIGTRIGVGHPEANVVAEIINRIDSLDRLMKDLLLFARPPVARLAQVDIVRLIVKTADLLRRDPGIAGVDVRVTGSAPPIQADAQLLELALQNLLVNAAHAAHGGGHVDVVVRQAGDRVEIDVRDSGPGVPPEIRDQIFTPFFTTKARGTGLGLPIAKQLIEAHHGELQLHSPRSGGAQFRVRLPVSST